MSHRPGSPDSRPRRLPPATVLLGVLLAIALLAAADPALADPDYGRPVLPGLDPLIISTRDPRLLGLDRLLVRERIMAVGEDPVTTGRLPDYDLRMRRYFLRLSGADLERMVTVVEPSSDYGLETVFTYPRYHFLFQASRTLPGGFVYYPPRDVGAPEVDLFVDDLDAAFARRLAVSNVRNRLERLNAYGQGGSARTDDGLINLTIPIKVPRTLEKIIGRGEKTSIRISGREHIKIAGETRRSNRFTASERRQNQSWFPSLDMEQQLQINLSGQIGERIMLEVDHNSEVIGPDATKIKLSFEGGEDDVIKSIETGDVGLTLPGSTLLGYSSNKSGLFGIKTVGQVGPAEFTVVASKQKAESASKSFNSKGGSATEHVIEAYRYLNNRFFRLDLPRNDLVVHDRPDMPGRDRATETIDVNSVLVYKFVGSGLPQTNDVRNIIPVPDTTGVWDPAMVDSMVTNHLDILDYGELWRPVPFELLLVQEGATTKIAAIDLKYEQQVNDVLVVTYDVDTADGRRWRVGDRPGEDEGNRVDIDGQPYYRMKLLKPQQPEPYTWQYVLRNIYSLGGTNIDASTFDFKIELNTFTDFPNLDLDATGNGSGLDWFRIFGLDVQNQQSQPGGDMLVDIHRAEIFDLSRGLLKFPLDFPEPFNASSAQYAAYADTSVFDYDTSQLSENLIPQIYDPNTNVNNMSDYTQFKLVATHAAAASSFNLGVSNIEEDSESVTLDGRTLTRDVDYEIDYLFGEVTLKGDAAASMTPDSQIGVNYQYAPFLGGGNSSLLGLNLSYDLGPTSRLSTTWLYESNQVVGHKAKLGEEPSRTLVGNLNGQFAFKPGLLTDVANLVSRRQTDRDSQVRLSGEYAVSVPNPNTFNEVFVEDFEGIDSSDLMPVSRLSWSASSAPVQPQGLAITPDDPRYDDYAYLLDRDYAPESRVETRWFLPELSVQRQHLNPALKEAEAREAQQVLQIHMRTNGETWSDDDWGGIMRGLGKSGVDLTKAQFLEFWVNDFRHEELGNERTGTLHFDFGYISEDFYWPVIDDAGTLDVGNWNREDRDGNGLWTIEEDTGLGDVPGDAYSADYNSDADPYPHINGTRTNNREDSEDLNGNTRFDEQNGYYTISVNLADSALVDVLRDYPAGDVNENIERSYAWRKYRIRLSDALGVTPAGGVTPYLGAVTHMRIWFEDHEAPPGTTIRNLQLSEIKFLGSRWEREGVRKVPTPESPREQLLASTDLPAGDMYFIGEVNNKENPDYSPPFSLYVENKIPEKETSLVLDYQNLDHQHMARASRVISTRGEDFTQYGRLVFYVYNPDPQQADMEVFYRVGADTLNFYEVNYRFDQSDGVRTGWREISIDLAELTNVKLQERDPVTGWIEARVPDNQAARDYDVRVVGAPDLRRVKRLYLGVRNTDRTTPASGYFYFNDVRLKEVKRDLGHAEKVAVSMGLADVVKLDFDWQRQDADFHGLDASTGQGHTNEDWHLSTSLKIEDFVPLLGFSAPVSYGKQSSVTRPKYMTNSDIEILDSALRDELSTSSLRENYSVRLSHRPSSNPLLRYLLDPWALTYSGSRSESTSPLSLQDGTNWQGSLSYNLQIRRTYLLGDYPGFGLVPLLKSVSLLPSKISATGSFSGGKSRVSNYSAADGDYVARPETETRTGNLSGNLTWKPLPLADISFNARSDRDMFRRREAMGFNVGTETVYSHSLQVGFNLPNTLGLPHTAVLMPITRAYAEFKKLRPSLDFNSSFTDDHSLNVQQEGDPPGTSNIGNDGSWSFRASLPIDRTFNRLFPKRREVSESQRRQVERAQRAGERGGDEVPDFSDHPRLADPGLTPEERQAIRDELTLDWLEEQERERQRRREEDGEAPEAETAEEGGGFSLPNPLSPMLMVLRGFEPVQFNYTKNGASGYGRYTGDMPFWYRVGLDRAIDTPDSTYASHTERNSYNMTMSTSTKVSRNLSMDFKYLKSRSENLGVGTHVWSYSQEWPDVNVSLSGLERLGLLGGGDGVFQQAGLQVGYKYTRRVPNYTTADYSPKDTRTFSPRLNLQFRSGMSVAMNVSTSSDRDAGRGSLAQTDRFAANLTVRHSFRAEGLLNRLGLYRPGAQPTINMNVDLTYNRDTTLRWNPGMDFTGDPATRVGNSRISVKPNFTYQISRNLSGAFHLTYSRNKVDETDSVVTTFGLGMEATFVF